MTCPRLSGGARETLSEVTQQEMEAAADLTVRLEVDAHVGETWYDAKG